MFSDSLDESMGTFTFQSHAEGTQRNGSGGRMCVSAGQRDEREGLNVSVHTRKTEGEAFFRDPEEFSFCSD